LKSNNIQTKKKKIDGCLIGNPCEPGTCVATGSTTYDCVCPTGYDNNGSSCSGIDFFPSIFVLPFFVLKKTDFIPNRYR